MTWRGKTECKFGLAERLKVFKSDVGVIELIGLGTYTLNQLNFLLLVNLFYGDHKFELGA